MFCYGSMEGGLGWQPSEFWDAPVYDIMLMRDYILRRADKNREGPHIDNEWSEQALERLNRRRALH